MGRSQRGEASILVADEWSTVWRCACGYENAGRDRCLMCGARAPLEARDAPGLYAEQDVLIPGEPTVDERAGRKAGRTVVAVIALNVIVQAVQFAGFVANDVERTDAIRISLFTGLLFYALAALWVLARSTLLGVRPWVGRTKALVGAAEGFVVGGAIAITFFGILRLVEGRPALDPTAALLAAEGSLTSLALGVLLIVVAAPVVEELVFRGFLAEALRGRGKRAAVGLSALAFSIAHLRLAQFRYYVLLGVVLALVYWRRGLVGSVTAHATFNGMLLLMAVVAGHGPALDAQAAGSTVSIPATYRTEVDVMGNDLVAVGPLGAQVEFAHVDADVGSAGQLARDVAQGRVPFPAELAVNYTTAVVIDLPAGSAVWVEALVGGEDGRLVALPTPGRLWIAVFRSDGSSRSDTEFDAMLRSWRVPTATT